MRLARVELVAKEKQKKATRELEKKELKGNICVGVCVCVCGPVASVCVCVCVWLNRRSRCESSKQGPRHSLKKGLMYARKEKAEKARPCFQLV